MKNNIVKADLSLLFSGSIQKVIQSGEQLSTKTMKRALKSLSVQGEGAER